MKNAGVTILAALAAVAGLLAYNALKPDRTLQPPTDAKVSAQLDQLRQDAARNHPDMAQSDAMKLEANQLASKMIQQGDAGERARTAAGLFFGGYYMNTRARAEYCRQRGVDLAPFVKAYEAANREDFARASAILARYRITPEALIPALQTQFVKVVDQDMKDFASGAQVDLDSVCPLFNENAALIVQSIALPADIRQALATAQ